MRIYSACFVRVDMDIADDHLEEGTEETLLLPPWGYPAQQQRKLRRTAHMYFDDTRSTFLLPPWSPPVLSPSAPRRPLGRKSEKKQPFQCYAPTCEAPNCPAHGKHGESSPSSSISSDSSDSTASSSSASLPEYEPAQAIVLPSTMLSGLAPIALPSEDKAYFVRPMRPELFEPFEPFEPFAEPMPVSAVESAPGKRKGGLPFTIDCAVRGLCLIKEGKIADALAARQ